MVLRVPVMWQSFERYFEAVASDMSYESALITTQEHDASS